MTKTRRKKPSSTTVRTRRHNRSNSRSTSLSTISTNTLNRTRKKKNRSQPSLSINPYLNLIEYIKNHEEHKLIEAIERIYREHNGCSNTKQECYEEKCLWIPGSRRKKGKCTLKNKLSTSEIWNYTNRLPNQTIGDWIKNNLINMEGLSDWEITKLLGMGTVGTVFEVVKGNDVCALKVQLANTEDQKGSIRNEVMMQLLAEIHAPQIYLHNGFIINDTNLGGSASGWYGIVMEIISKELDEYLGLELSNNELDMIGKQLLIILEFFNNKKFIHGDAVWFNLGITEEKIVKFIDYDRACNFFQQGMIEKFEDFKGLDVLRLILESYGDKAAPNQKTMNENNTYYLRLKYLIPYAQKIEVLPNGMSNEYDNILKEQIENLWLDMYENFCKYCKVKCLD